MRWSTYLPVAFQLFAAPVSLFGLTNIFAGSHEHREMIKALLKESGWRHEDSQVDVLDEEASAFCNTVYRVSSATETAVVKVFSPLALARMSEHLPVGDIDQYVAEQGLAPQILAATEGAIMMEYCDSKQDKAGIDKDCVNALAQLHSLDPPSAFSSENMLWRSCRVMAAKVDDGWTCGEWTKSKLINELENEKERILNFEPEVVSIGHGDCKASNFMRHGDSVLFIDLELAGRHYRGYDLAKLLRTDNDPSLRNSDQRRKRILTEYANGIEKADIIAQLQQEVDLLLPLTWLEAALFFATMEVLHPENHLAWNELSRTRLSCYEMCSSSATT